MYCAGNPERGNVGKYVGGVEETTAPPETTAPTTEPVTTEPTTAPPVTQPTTEQPTTTPTPETYTVKFTNSLNWSGTIYCYYWSEGEAGPAAWPGTPMTFVETNDYGQAVYSIEIPASADYVIFNNNNSQTVDIAFDGSALNFYALSEIDEMWHHLVGTW